MKFNKNLRIEFYFKKYSFSFARNTLEINTVSYFCCPVFDRERYKFSEALIVMSKTLPF